MIEWIINSKLYSVWPTQSKHWTRKNNNNKKKNADNTRTKNRETGETQKKHDARSTATLEYAQQLEK